MLPAARSGRMIAREIPVRQTDHRWKWVFFTKNEEQNTILLYYSSIAAAVVHVHKVSPMTTARELTMNDANFQNFVGKSERKLKMNQGGEVVIILVPKNSGHHPGP